MELVVIDFVRFRSEPKNFSVGSRWGTFPIAVDANQQDCLLVQDRSPANMCKTYLVALVYLVSCSCDFDLGLDPVTFVYELDLDILELYRHTKIKLLGRGFRTLEPKQAFNTYTDTQIHRQTDATERITTRHSRVVIMVRG